MQYIILLLSMLFCHIVDDYYLQGWLASAKQKSWWEKNAPDKMYKNDYKMALAEHAFSWTFMIHVPVIVALNYYKLFDGISIIFLFIFIINWISHAIIDDMKANKKLLNLIQDQAFHLFQIFLTGLIYICIIQIKVYGLR